MADAVEAIVFDLDDTICDYRRPGEEILELAFETVGVEPFFAIGDYYAIADDFVEESDSVFENRERCFAELAAESGFDPAIGRSIAEAYAAERDQSNVRPLPESIDVLESVGTTYDLALVTNGGPLVQSKKLEALDIEHHFDSVVFAGYDTAAKPHPEPLHVAVSELGTDPERAVKVGDSLELDVRGAHEAGLRSVWLDRNGTKNPDPKPDVRIESIVELHEEPWS